MHDAVGHPDAPPTVVERQQAEQAVVPGAEAVERGPGGVVGELGPVEGEVAVPEGPPVVPVLAAQSPDGAHPLSFPSTRSGGRDLSAGRIVRPWRNPPSRSSTTTPGSASSPW